MAPWESENSSASYGEGISGAVAAAVAAASQPQQQRQQQQLVSVELFSFFEGVTANGAQFTPAKKKWITLCR